MRWVAFANQSPASRAEDARHERLRVSIVKWEPARLHLHHDPVAGQEHVIRRWQRETVRQRPVRHDRFACSKLSR
jgi:hypothetical protein